MERKPGGEKLFGTSEQLRAHVELLREGQGEANPFVANEFMLKLGEQLAERIDNGRGVTVQGFFGSAQQLKDDCRTGVNTFTETATPMPPELTGKDDVVYDHPVLFDGTMVLLAKGAFGESFANELDAMFIAFNAHMRGESTET